MVVKRFRSKEMLGNIGVNVDTRSLLQGQKHVVDAMNDIGSLAETAGNLAFDVGKSQAIEKAKKEAGIQIALNEQSANEVSSRDENGVLKPPNLDNVGTYSFFDKQYRKSMDAAYTARLEQDTKQFFQEKLGQNLHDPVKFMELTNNFIKTTSENIPPRVAAGFISKAHELQSEYSRGITGRKATRNYARDQEEIELSVRTGRTDLLHSATSADDIMDFVKGDAWKKMQDDHAKMINFYSVEKGLPWANDQFRQTRAVLGVAMATNAMNDLIEDDRFDDPTKVKYLNEFITDIVNRKKMVRWGEHYENGKPTNKYRLFEGTTFNAGDLGPSNITNLKTTLNEMARLMKEGKRIRENMKLQNVHEALTQQIVTHANETFPALAQYLDSQPYHELEGMHAYQMVSKARSFFNSVVSEYRSDVRWEEWLKNSVSLKNKELTDQAAVTLFLKEFKDRVKKYPDHTRAELGALQLYTTTMEAMTQNGTEPKWSHKRRFLVSLFALKKGTLAAQDATSDDTMARVLATQLRGNLRGVKGLEGLNAQITKFTADFPKKEDGTTDVEYLEGLQRIINVFTKTNNMRISEIKKALAVSQQVGDDNVRRVSIKESLKFLKTMTSNMYGGRGELVSGELVGKELYDKVAYYQKQFGLIEAGLQQPDRGAFAPGDKPESGMKGDFKTLKQLSEAIANTFKTILAEDKQLLAAKTFDVLQKKNWNLKSSLGIPPHIQLGDDLEMLKKFNNATAILPLLKADNEKWTKAFNAQEVIRKERAPLINAARGGRIAPGKKNGRIIDELYMASHPNPDIARRNLTTPENWRDSGMLRAGLGDFAVQTLQGVLSDNEQLVGAAIRLYDWLKTGDQGLMAAPHLPVQLLPKVLGALEMARSSGVAVGEGGVPKIIMDTIKLHITSPKDLKSYNMLPDLKSGNRPTNDHEANLVIEQVMDDELDGVLGHGGFKPGWSAAFEAPLVDLADQKLYAPYPTKLRNQIIKMARMILPNFGSQDPRHNLVQALQQAQAILTSPEDPSGWGYSRLLGPTPGQVPSRWGNYIMVQNSPEARFQVPYIVAEADDQDPANPTGAEWILPVLRDIVFNRADYKAHKSMVVNFKGGHVLREGKSMFLTHVGNNDGGYPVYKVGIIDSENNVTTAFLKDRYTQHDLLIDFTKWEKLRWNLTKDPEKDIIETVNPYEIAYKRGEDHVVQAKWNQLLYASVYKQHLNHTNYLREHGLLDQANILKSMDIPGETSSRTNIGGSEMWPLSDGMAINRTLMEIEIKQGKRKAPTAKRGKNVVRGTPNRPLTKGHHVGEE